MATTLDLKNKRVLVMGLGLHDGGLGVARFLVEQGAQVTVTDLRTAQVLQPTLDKLKGLPITFVLGEHREEDFRQAEIVIKNPAVPRESPFLQIAREAGASIEMEMTLFFKLCPSQVILGITGTRGKTSTTVLAGELLKEWRSDTVVAGNLRVSALEKLPLIKEDTPVVLELSSWQLEGLGEQKLSPRYAAVTNLSPDHLNRYNDMADYAEAKRNIYRWQDRQGFVVLNADDPTVKTFETDAKGRVRWFSLHALEGLAAYLKDDLIFWLSGKGYASCPASLLQIPGRHNLANALAAIALVSAAGCPKEAIISGLQKFKGVADRLELVRELNGVRYYNDTTATSPAGTVAALQAFEANKGKIVLIAGGADKKLEFAPMLGELAKAARLGQLRHLILLEGTATPRLVEALDRFNVKISRSEVQSSFQAAIQEARNMAKEGDIVLLSPGCASFGMFTHEFERGAQFRELVEAL